MIIQMDKMIETHAIIKIIVGNGGEKSIDGWIPFPQLILIPQNILGLYRYNARAAGPLWRLGDHMTLRMNRAYNRRAADALANIKLNDTSLRRLKIMSGPIAEPKSIQLVKALKV